METVRWHPAVLPPPRRPPGAPLAPWHRTTWRSARLRPGSDTTRRSSRALLRSRSPAHRRTTCHDVTAQLDVIDQYEQRYFYTVIPSLTCFSIDSYPVDMECSIQQETVHDE